MRIPGTGGLCPVLVCLCFIQRAHGASHHLPARVLARNPGRNQSKLANGETEVHHRPKRGWIWNQFFVLEEHMGTEEQYVGKVRRHVWLCSYESKNVCKIENINFSSHINSVTETF